MEFSAFEIFGGWIFFWILVILHEDYWYDSVGGPQIRLDIKIKTSSKSM